MENSNQKNSIDLNTIIQMVNEYNKTAPKGKRINFYQEKSYDARYLFLCTYRDLNGEGLSIFQGQHIRTASYYDEDSETDKWNDGIIYTSIFSDKVAILFNHYFDKTVFRYADIGEWMADSMFLEEIDKIYYANCVPLKLISYNDIRMEMYNDGEIDNFNINSTSENEVKKVLAYAKIKYYNQSNAMKRQKTQ